MSPGARCADDDRRRVPRVAARALQDRGEAAGALRRARGVEHGRRDPPRVGLVRAFRGVKGPTGPRSRLGRLGAEVGADPRARSIACSDEARRFTPCEFVAAFSPESVPGFVFGKAARAQWHALRSRRLRRQASTLPLRCLLGLGREGPATSGPGSGHVVGEEGRPVVPQADAPQGTGDGENNFCRDPSRRG